MPSASVPLAEGGQLDQPAQRLPLVCRGGFARILLAAAIDPRGHAAELLSNGDIALEAPRDVKHAVRVSVELVEQRFEDTRSGLIGAAVLAEHDGIKPDVELMKRVGHDPPAAVGNEAGA